MSNQSVVTRIWDLFMWYGRRGPAVLVWVALAVLHGCRQGIYESHGLPATVKAVRRYAEGCKSFDDLVRQAPIGLDQVIEHPGGSEDGAICSNASSVVGCNECMGGRNCLLRLSEIFPRVQQSVVPVFLGYSLFRGGLRLGKLCVDGMHKAGILGATPL